MSAGWVSRGWIYVGPVIGLECVGEPSAVAGKSLLINGRVLTVRGFTGSVRDFVGLSHGIVAVEK